MSLADTIIRGTEEQAIKQIKQGADPNQVDRYGFRPLIQAVICKKSAVLEALLDHGADIDQQDVLGRTPLQWAADRNAPDFCLALLQRGANPNHYSADGQPLLVNPILREQMELVHLLIEHGGEHQFAQDFISAKLTGHRFELAGETDIVSPDSVFVALSFEGFYLEFTCELIRRSLNNFFNSIPGQKYERYQDKVRKILHALDHAAKLMEYSRHKDKSMFEPVIDTILDDHLLVLPVGHRGHAITLIKYGEYFAKCDRGVNNITDTVIIYKIGNPYLFDKKLCKQLLYEKKPEEFISHQLKDILKLKPIQKLATKSQIAGNCSWANVEASVPAMLYLLGYNELVHQGTTSGGQLKRSVNGFYAAWVEWDKDSALEELINDFDQADHARQISKAMIMGSVLTQRCHPNKTREVARAKKILSRLCMPAFQFLLKNYIRVYQRPAAKHIGKKVIKLFKECGLDFDDLSLPGVKQRVEQIEESHEQIRMTTALHVASLTGHYESVKYLLDKVRMEVDYRDRTGSTALMYAAWKGHMDIVRYLVKKHHADVSCTNNKGGTARRYALYAGHEDIARFLLKYE